MPGTSSSSMLRAYKLEWRAALPEWPELDFMVLPLPTLFVVARLLKFTEELVEQRDARGANASLLKYESDLVHKGQKISGYFSSVFICTLIFR